MDGFFNSEPVKAFKNGCMCSSSMREFWGLGDTALFNGVDRWRR